MPLKSDQSSAPSERSASGTRYFAQAGSGAKQPRSGQEERETNTQATMPAQIMIAAPRKPDHVTGGEHERIDQARVAARVTVPLRPLERVAARGGAGVVEVDEDVVERRRPLSPGLHEHVAVEGSGRDQGGKPSYQWVQHAVDGVRTLLADPGRVAGDNVVLFQEGTGHERMCQWNDSLISV